MYDTHDKACSKLLYYMYLLMVALKAQRLNEKRSSLSFAETFLHYYAVLKILKVGLI